MGRVLFHRASGEGKTCQWIWEWLMSMLWSQKRRKDFVWVGVCRATACFCCPVSVVTVLLSLRYVGNLPRIFDYSPLDPTQDFNTQM